MADSSADTREKPVTVVIARRPKQGKESEMETFLNGITSESTRFPGYLGVTLFCPSNRDDPEYRAIIKFDSLRNYQAWETSEARSEWVKIGDAISQEPPQIKILSGLETWFSLPGAGAMTPPSKHKMVLLAWFSIFPLSMLLNGLLGPHVTGWSIPSRSFVFSAILTPLMGYVALPGMTRLFSRWLYPNLPER